MSKEHYTTLQAINVMKALSKQGRSFNATFMKITGGKSSVSGFRLVKPNLKNDSKGKYKLQFINDNDDRRSCYIPLLMSLNGKRIKHTADRH